VVLNYEEPSTYKGWLTNDFKPIFILLLLYSNVTTGHLGRVMDWKNDGTPIRKQAGGVRPMAFSELKLLY